MIRCLLDIEQARAVMKRGHLAIVFSILLLSMAIPAAAQRTRKPAPKPTPKPTKPVATPEVAAAKQKVSNQLYNVNTFVDKMGPIAVAIEDIDKESETKRLSQEVIDANEANKQKVILAIRGLREGLRILESDFRTKPALTKYLPQIQGIANLCALSEDSAIAGKFVASKEPLRQVAMKLTDTMAVMP
ncbi:MAG: hypothetical protein IPM25_04370 [Chloracidobacterium sp.]|nr:hypothetical protein [Chloracidobacterium sp.]